ncbi:MAG: cation diffusion facilitator family transporter [Acidimicrobiales bacterium]
MTRSSRLGASLGLNAVLVGLLAGFGLWAHSLALLADAGHNLADVAAITGTWVAVRWAMRPSTQARSFGYHRGTILAALANATLTIAVTAVIAWEAAHRISHPGSVNAVAMVGIGAVALAINLASVLLLNDRSEDLNMRTAAWHMAADAFAGLGVIAAGVVIMTTTGLQVIDPAVSLGIGAVIVIQSWKLVRESVDVLLESTPSDMDLSHLTSAMEAVRGVSEVHDLHVWSLSSEVRALSAHLVLSGHPSLEGAQAVADEVKGAISKPFSISHATLETECERCVDAAEDPCGVDTALHANAHRNEVSSARDDGTAAGSHQRKGARRLLPRHL